MKDTIVINEIKKLDILIGKKMFAIAKIENTNNPPSPLQFKILDYLLNNQNIVFCPKDLEKKFNVSKAAISGVLLTMEKRGIITMVASSTDARSKNIKLTDKSIERFNEMKSILKRMNDELVKGIPKEDLNTFLKVLEDMRQNLNKLN